MRIDIERYEMDGYLDGVVLGVVFESTDIILERSEE